MIHSCFIQEQKRYSITDLSKLMNANIDDLLKVLKRLREYGVLKIVNNNREELDRSDLLLDEELLAEVDSTLNCLYVFNFVGVFIVSDMVFKCYPKYIESNNYKKHLKKILLILDKYKAEYQSIPSFYTLNGFTGYNRLPIMIYLIRDFLEHGTYNKQESILEYNGMGSINWDKTINDTFAIINNNRPFYYNLITKRTQINDLNYFNRLHKAIITKCSESLKEMDLLDLFSLDEVNVSDESISAFGDLDNILYEIEKEMNIQFNTRYQFLLKLMHAFLSNNSSFNKSDDIYVYGTTNFKKIWEDICKEVLDNDLNKPLGNIHLPKKLDSIYNPSEDTLLSIIDRPIWNLQDSSKKFTNILFPKSTFIPDCVKIKNNSLFIYDAKYYVPRFKNNYITEQPGIEDVSKQFLYQLAYKDFMIRHDLIGFKNYFLIPSEHEQKNRIYITFKIFNDIGLDNIEVKFIDADSIYNAYLKNEKYTDL